MAATMCKSPKSDLYLIKSLNQIKYTKTHPNISKKKNLCGPQINIKKCQHKQTDAHETKSNPKRNVPVLERRRMPKSQLEVMSMDWERSQEWPSGAALLPSLEGAGTAALPPLLLLLPDSKARGHFSRSTSWSISTISHIPVSSLVTWDWRMCARMIVGLSRKAMNPALRSVWMT